jgi:hypothetical protein
MVSRSPSACLGLAEFTMSGEKQSHQPNAMFALKLFSLCPALDRDLLQFPDSHEHQSTKGSRRNQWENGSTGRMLTLPFRSDQPR